MLRTVTIDTLPNGKPVTIPAEISSDNFEQQIKRFIEIADYNTMDGYLHIALFRQCHGGGWTIKILEAIMQELQNPAIELIITHERDQLLPFFVRQIETHMMISDSEYEVSQKKPDLP